jgi:hypothetical protein
MKSSGARTASKSRLFALLPAELRRFTAVAATIAVVSINQMQICWAASSSADNQPARGTMLIPLIPKIDTGNHTPAKPSGASTSAAPAGQASTSATPAATAGAKATAIPEPGGEEQLDVEVSSSDKSQSSDARLAPTPEKISPEQGDIADGAPSEDSEIGEGTTLKGMIQMIADDTEYDQDKNTFLGTGNAIVYIGDQNAKLEADTILLDQTNEIIDARGNVRIFRDGQVTTGSAFKFKITSDEYLITKPDTEVQGTTVIARRGVGSKTGMAFRNGTVQMPAPFHLANNSAYGPLGSSEIFNNQTLHPDAYLPSQPSFRFKARKIIYEKYKENNNITIFGGKLMFGNFGVPLPKMVLTAGAEEQRAVMPITPVIANNMQMGGTSIGPQFNYRVGDRGVFSWAPLLQLGGSTLKSDDPNHKSLGAGVRIGYVSEKVTSHLAYGSNSNLLVAEYKYKFSKNTMWQSGINRYLNEGIFGYRRARLLGDLVVNKSVGNIPFLTGINFRTAAGFAQDNPDLLNQTPSLKSLYNLQGNQGKLFALRAQEQVTTTTHPIFALGDDKIGTKFFFYGGAGIKGYSTGDSLALAQGGPILDVKLDRLRVQTGYVQSGVSGKSPFVFDQFIQGSRSATVNGDIRVCKYLTVGGMLGYNLDAKALYQKTLKVAVGPDDFKFLFSHDTLSGYNRFGFNVMYGAPVQYDKLVLKGSPDTGKLGGI